MNKPMWDWLDKVEGKKEGSSSANLEKEKKRQGYKTSEAKKKKIAGRMKFGNGSRSYPKGEEVTELRKHRGEKSAEEGLKEHKDYKRFHRASGY